MTTDLKDCAADAGSDPAPQASSCGPGLPNALEALKRAILAKKIEPICMAYQAVRLAGFAMKAKEIFEAIDASAGASARGSIVSAYSHRQCFMCEGGTVPCDQCDGSGLAEPGRVCPNCRGFAITSCTFCQGTGWAEISTIPPEIARSVQERQVKYVMDEMVRVQQQAAVIQAEKLQLLDQPSRRRLGEWLMRLQARLDNLLERPAALSAPQKQQFAAAMADIDRMVGGLVDGNRREAIAAAEKNKKKKK